MLLRRNVLDKLHIGRPGDALGVLRASNRKFEMWRPLCWLDEQPLKQWLAIGAVGAEEAQIPSVRCRRGGIKFRINRAIERAGCRGPIVLFDMRQNWATRERQIEIVSADLIWGEIGAGTGIEIFERNGRIDIVKGFNSASGRLHEMSDSNSIWHVRTHDDCISRGDRCAMKLQL